MTSRVEYTPSDDEYLAPADKETIEASEVFGRHIQETVDMLDTFFSPTSAIDRWHLPFGRFGDGRLTILAERSPSDSTLALGFRALDSRGDFYASASTHSDYWKGKGDDRYDDESVARMLSANWPSLTIDNTAARALEAKGGSASFKDFSALLYEATQTYGTEESSTHAFCHSWKWDDCGKDARGETIAIIERTNGQKQAYRLEVTLPHEYGKGRHANVTCIARFDEAFGTTYDIKVDDPTLSRLHISLPDIIELLEVKLQALMDAKITAVSKKLSEG